jgi:hypothetical protein
MLWVGFPAFFLTISYNDQRAIHNYFRPADNLTDEQLLEHFKAAKAQDPRLPSAAGRAFRKLETIYRRTSAEARGDPEPWAQLLAAHHHQTVGSPGRRHRLVVSALARPAIDTRSHRRQ